MTPDEVRADYREAMAEVGEIMMIRRYYGVTSQTVFNAEVRGRVWDSEPKALADDIVEGTRRALILAEDLIAAQVPLDLRNGDKLVVRGKALNIEAADDSTHRVAGVLIAYELRVRGTP